MSITITPGITDKSFGALKHPKIANIHRASAPLPFDELNKNFIVNPPFSPLILPYINYVFHDPAFSAALEGGDFFIYADISFAISNKKS